MTSSIHSLSASAQREPVLAAAPARGDIEQAARSTASEKSAALDDINHSLRMSSIGVRFEFDKEADLMIAKVVDVESGEVIRQMPSEEVVHISKVLGRVQGLLVSQKV